MNTFCPEAQRYQPDRVKTEFGEYAEKWLAWRNISGRTRDHYRRLLDRQLLPTLAAADLRDISSAEVDAWFGRLTATPSVRNHSYSLLRSIMETALVDKLIDTNPCRLTGGEVNQVDEGLTLTELAGGFLISAPDAWPADRVVAAMTATLAVNGLDEIPH